MRRMRAAVLHGREDVRVEVVELLPLEPGEVLLRTRAALTHVRPRRRKMTCGRGACDQS